MSSGPRLSNERTALPQPIHARAPTRRRLGSSRRRGGRRHADRYIYERETGEVVDGLRVVRFSQADARFLGAELEAHLDIREDEPHHLDVEVSADLVRARLTDPASHSSRRPTRRRKRRCGGPRRRGLTATQ